MKPCACRKRTDILLLIPSIALGWLLGAAIHGTRTPDPVAPPPSAAVAVAEREHSSDETLDTCLDIGWKCIAAYDRVVAQRDACYANSARIVDNPVVIQALRLDAGPPIRVPFAE